MTTAGKPPAETAAAGAPAAAAPPKSFETLLQECCSLLLAAHKNTSLDARIFRRMPLLRERFSRAVFLRASSMSESALLSSVKFEDAAADEQVETGGTNDFAKFWQTAEADGVRDDCELFFLCVALATLLHQRKFEAAADLAKTVAAAIEAKHSLECLLCLSRTIHLVARSFEAVGELSSLRPVLLKLHRRAAIAANAEAQAACLNWSLRALLAENEYQEAYTLAQRAIWPSCLQMGAELCRWLLVMARIHAVRLDYLDAHEKVQLALRKAPARAAGFRLAAKKLSVLVTLLRGEIPARLMFVEEPALWPYAKVVQAVRTGDLCSFRAVVDGCFKEKLQKDGNLLLVRRLENNVTRIGLSRIATSYSRIPLKSLGAKLGLNSLEDARCVVAKAIADGLIDAMVDPATDTVVTLESQATSAAGASGISANGAASPTKAFNERIGFCLQLYADAVQAMHYAENSRAPATSSELDETRVEQQEQLARAENEFEDDEF